MNELSRSLLSSKIVILCRVQPFTAEAVDSHLLFTLVLT